MNRSCILSLLAAFCALALVAADAPSPGEQPVLRLNLRQRSERAPGSDRDRITEKQVEWDPRRTAVVVCDMWDTHWCQGAARRVAEMAPRMNEAIAAARDHGALIIHCPSSCLEPYRDTPQRRLAQNAPPVATDVPLKRWCYLIPEREGMLPIDDSDGGCDCQPQCPHGEPWKRQIATIEIREGDAITDSAEAFYLMKQRGITNVMVLGVHVNMCVLGRPFSIRQMVQQGQNVVLVRDLTDSMYNPRKTPQVSHCRGTELVVEHIEKHWCPTISSTDLTGKPAFHFAEDQRPHVVFVVGEDEYNTAETLPAFSNEELSARGLRCTFVHADPRDKHNFPGIEALQTADLLVLSVRRRALPQEQLQQIRDYLDGGRPLVAIRTSSHAFDVLDQQPADGHAEWPEFDAQVLGGNYQGHHANKEPGDPQTFVQIDRSSSHPILQGLPAEEWLVRSWLYKTSPLAPGTTTLLTGRVEGREPREPVAWTNSYRGGRVFYTSLGHPDEFELPAFRRLLLNSVFWALDRPVSQKEQTRSAAAQ